LDPPRFEVGDKVWFTQGNKYKKKNKRKRKFSNPMMHPFRIIEKSKLFSLRIRFFLRRYVATQYSTFHCRSLFMKTRFLTDQKKVKDEISKLTTDNSKKKKTPKRIN